MALGPKLAAPGALQIAGAFSLFHTLLMLSVGAYFGIKSASLALSGTTAEGTVVDETRSSKGSTTPIVEFTTPTGQRVRFKGDVSSRPPEYKIGEKVTVRYSPTDPSHHAIDSFLEMWLLPAILVPFGGIGGIIGAVLMFVGVRRKRARERVAATGLHAPASIVGSRSVAMKNSTQYDPEVELRDPRTGEALRCTGDRQRNIPLVGGAATVHIDTNPPHGYFVEVR